MSTKLFVARDLAKHPFSKKVVSKEDLVKLTGQLAEDGSMGEQWKNTLEIES